ncbi:MAG: hypothetical protein ABIK73_07750 [candidate division WOR-3 bacterium]
MNENSYKMLILTRGFALLKDDVVVAYYDFFGRPHRADIPKLLEEGDLDIILECPIKKKEFFQIMANVNFEFNRAIHKVKKVEES